MTKLRKTILVIDDSRDILDVLELVLKKNGYSVHTALNDEILENLMIGEGERPDILLLDMLLGDKDGFEIADALRKNTRTRDLPIIIMSAHTSAAARMKGKKGKVMFIAKPFTSEEILALIRAAIAH
jgi:DNA-binding response OmpR family regulator